MGFLEFLAMLSGAKAGIKQSTKKKQETDNLDWETECENCGELLEDCVCDDKELSLEDISLLDMMDEDDEESDELEDDEENDLSFDNFESLDEDDDEW